MADPTALPRADEYADEANERIAELVTKAITAASLLADFTDGAGLDVTRLALNGTDDQLDAWRDTRPADAELQMIVARWREHWKTTVNSNRRLGNLRPKALDVYGWEAPEECDHQAVRLGADVVQRDGHLYVTLLHVDLARVAQQPTRFRLLGPTAALDLFGTADGIIQDGHPLRTGTSHGSPHYRPTDPTWIPPKVERPPPRKIPWDPAAHARAINERRQLEEAQQTGGVR